MKKIDAIQKEFGKQKGHKIVTPAVRKAMKPVEDRIRSNTPTDRGDLRASTTLKAGKPSKKLTRESKSIDEFTISVARAGWFWRKGDKVNVYQALAVEFGTVKVDPTYTIINATKELKGTVASILTVELGRSLDKFAKKLAKQRLGK